MDKLRIAIVGCGRISYKHVEAIVNNSREIELVAVCDIIEGNAVRRSDEYKKSFPESTISIYTDYKKMLENEVIDLISLATESGYHPEIAIYCMNKGKHIIVEKPMALSTEDADRMIECAAKNNVKLCISHQNRFNAPIQKLRTAVEKGRFGKLINAMASIRWTRDMGYYTQAPWRGTWELDGGTLMNQCIHDIDLLQWMMGGEVESVYAQTGTFLRSIEGEDFGAIIIRFKNNAIGIIEGSACVYPKNLEETLSIFGEKGAVSIGGLAVNRIETWRFGDNIDNEEAILLSQEGDPDSVYGHGHTPLFKDMIDAINNNREPLINGVEGKKGMEIILAAYKSQKTGMPVKFPMGSFSTLEMKK
jgi:UDP-N-acetyl-2-amino-2-deoxyglucuronate dehydrogenase